MTLRELRDLAARSGFTIELAGYGSRLYRIIENKTGRRLLARDGGEHHRLNEIFETLTERC